MQPQRGNQTIVSCEDAPKTVSGGETAAWLGREAQGMQRKRNDFFERGRFREQEALLIDASVQKIF